MKLKLIEVKYPGELYKEHLVLDCKEDTDLGRYMVLKLLNINNIVTCLWLPDIRVKFLDRIYIYTKFTESKNAEITKYVSLGRKEPLWSNRKNHSMVLVECKDWKFGTTF